MKNKLLLVESEMKSPKGHFLDNLIETTVTFKKKLNIMWMVNKEFDNEKTYLPNKIRIFKSISTNKFKRKDNKLFYIIEEVFLFFVNLFQILFFSLYFLKEKKFSFYLNALKSNYFLLPRYFPSFYWKYKNLKLTKNDNVFFQTARRKDIALINFLIKIDEDHPKFHIRVMLPPKIRFKGFFYYLKEIDNQLKSNRAFVYLFSDSTFNLFIKNSIGKKGIFKSNIPWSFHTRKSKIKNHVVGYVGNARKARGFHLLPQIIKSLDKKSKSLKYLIQFSKASSELISIKNELVNLAKKNNKIKIIEKYCDYKEFRSVLKKIDIMPIIHEAKEINTITSGTMYSSLSHEIPVVIPKGTKFMKNILKYKSFENAKNLDQFANKILKISKNYKYYLNNVKLNSNLLKKMLKNDPLRKNIY
tara:strand:- start:492 stop:1736 length:1245 start_codon:yes stop_codon:yes gene_type:complete